MAEFPSRFVGAGADREKIVAVLESIVFLLAVNLEELARHAPAPRRLVLSGGLASLDPLCQRLADLSGLEVIRPQVREATARGLAFLLAGRPGHWPPTGPQANFQAQACPPLAQRFQRWRETMDAALFVNARTPR